MLNKYYQIICIYRTIVEETENLKSRPKLESSLKIPALSVPMEHPKESDVDLSVFGNTSNHSESIIIFTNPCSDYRLCNVMKRLLTSLSYYSHLDIAQNMDSLHFYVFHLIESGLRQSTEMKLQRNDAEEEKKYNTVLWI